MEDVLEVSELDSVSTQEIVADDILDVMPLRQRVYPNPRITHLPETDPAYGMPAIPPPAPTPWDLATGAMRMPTIAPSMSSTMPLPPPRPPYYSGHAAAELAPPAPKVATIAPVAFDLDPLEAPASRRRAESTFSLDTFAGNRTKRRRVDVAIAIAVGAFVGVFLLGITLRSVSAKPVVEVGALRATAPAAPGRTPIAIARATTAPSTPPSSALTALASNAKTTSTSGTPTIDVSSLPQAPVGTVSLAPAAAGHRLFIDGSVYASGSAVVTCGKHVVRVGSRGHAQVVDVACGSDLVITP